MYERKGRSSVLTASATCQKNYPTAVQKSLELYQYLQPASPCRITMPCTMAAPELQPPRNLIDEKLINLALSFGTCQALIEVVQSRYRNKLLQFIHCHKHLAYSFPS